VGGGVNRGQGVEGAEGAGESGCLQGLNSLGLLVKCSYLCNITQLFSCLPEHVLPNILREFCPSASFLAFRLAPSTWIMYGLGASQLSSETVPIFYNGQQLTVRAFMDQVCGGAGWLRV
jgi:hypothetical protein